MLGIIGDPEDFEESSPAQVVVKAIRDERKGRGSN